MSNPQMNENEGPQQTPGDQALSVALIVPGDDWRLAIAGMLCGTSARVVREFSRYPDENTIAKLIAGGCNALILDLDSNVEAGMTLIESICARYPAVIVMACSGKSDTTLVIRAMQAGAREFLTLPVTAETLQEAIGRAASRRLAALPGRAAGKVLIFQSAKGGAGATTLATNFALALTKETTEKVVLVDLHPQLGEVALNLGLEPRFSIVDALANPSRLDAEFLTGLLTKHESGLMVLASENTYGTHRSLERGSDKLFRLLREQFAYVVVDAGSCTGSTPGTLFALADTVYVVAQVDIPSLRNARRVINWFAGRENVRGLEVVLNRFDSRSSEIDEDSAVKALSRPANWKIPNDYNKAKNAQNLGIPLTAQDSPISRVLSLMAASACGKSTGLPDAKGRATARGDKWKFWASNAIKPQVTVGS